MATIVTRSGKGSPLTNNEVDANFNNLNTEVGAALPKAGGAMTGAITTNSTIDGRDVAADGVTADAALPKSGGAMTGAITTNSTFDGVDIATRDAVLTNTTTTANAALPKAGGAMTGAITTNSTFDGRDVAADGVTADAALPKAGGAMTGAITTNSTFDGRDVATDGTKLDGIEASATADQTGAQIKTAYEAETNAFTDAQFTKLSGIESSATADQTAAQIKTAYESNANTQAFTDADHTKLDGIEASADVTDTANVTSAGALMDSELTSIASVKALNQGLATGNSPTFVNVTAASLDISGNIDIDGVTNLDVVDIDGACDMASTLAVGGVLTANAGVVVDNFTLDGTTLALSSGDFTVDVAGDIILDAGGAQIRFHDDGTDIGVISNESNNFIIKSQVSDADLIFKGNDGGSTITALTLDMSDAGNAFFNNHVNVSDSKAFIAGTNSDFQMYHLSGANVLHTTVSDADMTFKGNDGGSVITALTLDMSAAGAASFNSSVTAGGAYTSNMSGGQSSLQLEVGGANKAIVGLEPAVGGGSANDLSIYSRSGALRFWANGAEKLTIATNGAATFSSSISAVGQITSARGSDTGTYGFRHEGAGKFMRMGVPNASFAYFETDATGGFSFEGNVSVADKIIHAGDTDTYLQFNAANTFRIVAGNDERFRVSTGEVVVNESSLDMDFRVESNGNANMLFVDGGNNKVGIGTATSSSTSVLTINDNISTAYSTTGYGATPSNSMLYLNNTNGGSNTASLINFRTGSGDGVIGFVEGGGTNNADFVIQTDGGSNGVERFRITNAGEVTMPYQPAFLTQLAGTQSNIAVGLLVNVLFATERFDVGSNFASNTFTAPVTGKYQLNCHVLMENVDSASNYYQLQLTTSNRIYYDTFDPGTMSADSNYESLTVAVLAEMEAGDTAIVKIIQATGTAQTDLNLTTSTFSGFLAC